MSEHIAHVFVHATHIGTYKSIPPAGNRFVMETISIVRLENDQLVELADLPQLSLDLGCQTHRGKAGQVLGGLQQDGREPLGTHIVQTFPHAQDHLLGGQPIVTRPGRRALLARQTRRVQEPHQTRPVQSSLLFHLAEHPAAIITAGLLISPFSHL